MRRKPSGSESVNNKPVTLTSYDRWHRGIRNYDWLHGVVPGATDIDAFIERRGRFLIIEGKRWFHGVWLPLGQQIALQQLVGVNDLTADTTFTVYLIGEEMADSDGEHEDVFHVMRFGRAAPAHRGRGGAFYPPALFEQSSRDDLRQLVRQWIEAA